MNQTMLTVQGWIGTTPMLREVGGVPVLNFRLGCTPRHFNRSSGAWVDGETQWYAVSAWRRLATHAEPSLRQGDPVVVHGRLGHHTYVNKSGSEVVVLEIDAVTIGHDLTRGTSSFVKAAASGPGSDPERDGVVVAA
ncbi:single-stranded DNA-binding protein [Nocardioides nitrophenolicus]|uniref:single-stranded DNA-binding protein n=1 Tax=Nocardioides nitrophenolicus TaxID=60489 RepID=UPI0019583DCB|nr:single-stranded DNA-binding protein [Nocardioides nitrophenolicus]MBM7515899.1 single-strand DNA-binding protein [Nocardioides nitrophenolicus]